MTPTDDQLLACAKRLAEAYDYDWSSIDNYTMGSCLIPCAIHSSAREGFLTLAKARLRLRQ